MNEAETRAKLIDTILNGRGWTEDNIRLDSKEFACSIRPRLEARIDN